MRLIFSFFVILCTSLISCSNSYKQSQNLEIPLNTIERAENIYHRLGYTVSFNPELNIPNWVAWELNSSKLVEKESRAGHFYPDPDIPRGIAVETGDYSNSGYDRGHMCPAADNKWDKQAMRESFYMTNICPQHHNLNRGDWKELEDDCRRWVEESGTIYIVCGPILYKNLLAELNYKRFLFKKLCILLIFNKLKILKHLIDKYRMHNLYAIFAKLLNICKQIAGNLVNESGNVPK